MGRKGLRFSRSRAKQRIAIYMITLLPFEAKMT
jgi:hypothetical protein